MLDIDFWRYQVINTGTEEDPLYGVHEVYFNEKTGRIVLWTEDPIALDGYENKDELEKILSDIKKLPILLESELEKATSK